MARKPFRAVEKPIMTDGRLGLLPSAEMCVECPLSKASTPGFLGGYTMDQYIETLHSRADIACHLSAGFKAGDRERQRSCTGVAMYRSNVQCLPTGHALDAMLAIGPDPAAFESPRQFLLHHQPGYAAELQRGAIDVAILGLLAEAMLMANADAATIDEAALKDGFNPLDLVARIDTLKKIKIG